MIENTKGLSPYTNDKNLESQKNNDSKNNLKNIGFETTKETTEYNTDLVILSENEAENEPANPNYNDSSKTNAFMGHFDLNISSMSEKGLITDELKSYEMNYLSFSISFDVFASLSENLTKEDKETLNSVFGGKDFTEFKDSFFGLTKGEAGLNEFSKEIDDLFSKLSEVVDIDDKFFEGVKKMYMFSAVMFVNEVDKNNSASEIDSNVKDNTANMFSDMSKMYDLLGNKEKATEKASEAFMTDPKSFIHKKLLESIVNNEQSDKNLLNNKKVNKDNSEKEENDKKIEERNEKTAQMLNNLVKQAKNVEKYIE